jgi:Domain of unknown function (DUF4384)
MNGQESLRGEHLPELTLRRLRSGEALAATSGANDAAHAGACAECRARLKGLEDEQRRFEQEISFDRFAAGVERAARAQAAPRRARFWSSSPSSASSAWSWRAWGLPALGVAAAVTLFVTFAPRRPPADAIGNPTNRVKGGAGITVRVAAGDGPQRTAAADVPEALAPGERVRIGYQRGAHRYLLALSVDDRGQVTPLYPEAGRSVSVEGRAKEDAGLAPRYLPDSVEFTDAGTERLIVVLSDAPLDVEAARRAARASFERAKGDILHLPPLELPGEQFGRTFIKP